MRIEVVRGPVEVIEKRVNSALEDIESHKLIADDGILWRWRIQDIKFIHADGNLIAIILWEAKRDD